MSDKINFRKQFLQIRNEISEVDQAKKSQNICLQIVQLEVFKKAKHILIYYPLKNEVDLRPHLSFDLIKNWYLPKIINQTEFIALPFKHISDLEQSKYPFFEPRGSLEESKDHLIDLIFVPGIAFDISGNRLGMGKGYYDRYLNKARNILKIGVAFKEQIVNTVPTERHDIQMDMVIFDHL